MTAEPDLRGTPGAPFPPGPPLLSRLVTGRAFRQDPVHFLTENARLYGDLVHFRSLEGHVFQVNHPDLIRELLVDNERRNRRAAVMQRARGLLGEGLLTSEEPLHMRQRRLAAPAFHRARIAAYAEVIATYAAEITRQWQPGNLDVHPAMLLLALRIVGKCLFNIDREDEARAIAAAVSRFMVRPPPGWVPVRLLEFLQHLPLGPMLEVRRGIDQLDQILYTLIADRRQNPGDRGDLLSMLLAAEDSEDTEAPEAAAPTTTEAPDSDARRMSDKQVRDECLTVLLAGHETTANALSFTLWQLAQNPSAQEAVHHEAVAVLGNRPPTAGDYPRLTAAYAAFAEGMRLMPTVWVIGRSAGPEPYPFRGFTIPPGAMLLAPQIVVHRDPRFWQNPDHFDPAAHFSEDAKAARPKLAYFPFGGGARQCIGEGLAWMEGVFVLATILRDWRLSPQPGAPAHLPVLPSVNLRPKNGVPLVLERR